MKISSFFVIAIAFLFVFVVLAPSAEQGTVDWPAYNGGFENTHYSTLSQIDRSNVSRLQVAWTFDSGDAFPESEMECNPLVVNGVLYFVSPKLNVIALNAATGELKWRFDPNEGKPVIGKQRNRGLTHWTDGKEERIFAAAHQFLYALDARTGKAVDSFGQNGRIDLRDGLGREPRMMAGMNTPGVIYKDLLIVGDAVAEVLPAPPGDIRAFDVRTGKLRWSFHTIPHPGEFGYETWPRDAWKYSGAANAWSGLSLDPKRGLVFVPLGSASSDFYGANRLGDDLFANSLVALNAETGERVWHFQTVRHDIWDRDLDTPPTLVTVMRNGQPVDAVAQPTKSGFIYLFNREDGTPLFPIAYKHYPPSDVEGEVTADSEPLPTAPEPFARQILSPELVTERTPEARADVLARLAKMRSNGQFIPPSVAGTIIFPGLDGGAEWGGAAFDPATHLLYVNANEMPWILRLVEEKPPTSPSSGKSIYLRECAACHKENMQGTPPEFPSLAGVSSRRKREEVEQIVAEGSGRMPSFVRLGPEALHAVESYVYNGEDLTVQSEAASPYYAKYAFAGYDKFLDKDGYPPVRPPWGTLNAINLDTGKYAWRFPFGEYPELAEGGMKNTGSENYGGPVVTAGGLIFIAATSFDKKMHAFDKETGKLLWEATLPAAGNATPAVYEVNGRQYVAIAAGGGKSKAPTGGSVVAFTLPK